MSLSRIALLAALLTATGVTNSRAAFTASYSTLGVTGTAPSLAETSTTGTTAGTTFGNVTRGAGIGANAATNAFNSNNFSQLANFPTGSTSYLTFTITPGAGATLSLSEIDLYVQRSATGPGNLDLRSSLNNYATSLFSTTIASSTSPIPVLAPISLSGITSAVTFELFAYGSTSANGTFRLQDSGGTAGGGTPSLVITGNATTTGASVPEPASIALVGLGLAGAVFGLRRKAA